MTNERQEVVLEGAGSKDGGARPVGVFLMLVEAAVAAGLAIKVRMDAATQIDDAFGISAIQVQQVNGKATLDVLVIAVVALCALAVTAAAFVRSDA